MEKVFNLFIGLFIVFYMTLAFFFDKHTVSGDVFGARGFPILLACLGLAVLGLIVQRSLKSKTKVQIPLFDIKSSTGKLLLLNVAIFSLYLLVMNVIGYILSTLLFILGTVRTMGYKKIPALLVFTISLSVVLVLLFGKVFSVPLPRGMGIFRELSYYVY